MKKALGLLVFAVVSSMLAYGQAKGDRFNGVWTVSRGGGGMGRVFVDGTKLKGVLMDSGWLQMTGERRIGQLSGSIRSGEASITIEWSTGAKTEFRGPGKVQRKGLTLDLEKVVGSKIDKETQFSLQAHQVGDPLSEPFGNVSNASSSQLAGEWSGSFVYGPNSGIAYVTMGWDGACNVVMANEKPNDSTWSAEGEWRSGILNLTVNSGASKQSYKGKIKSIGPDQMQVTFDRDKGSFIMTLSRW